MKRNGSFNRSSMIQPDITFTVSARGKKEHQPVLEFLETEFSSLPPDQVDSVFGFVEPSSLYSGRPYINRQLSEADVEAMYSKGIGLRIPCTNHVVSREEYKQHEPFFEKYHREGNSVICTSDDLAGWLRKDFPSYQVEASILKEIDTREKIDRAFDLYHTVILPMNLNLKTDFLSSITVKERITLFGNAGCALTCPNRSCYRVISGMNKKLVHQGPVMRNLYIAFRLGFQIDWCSYRLNPRKLRGLVDFDLDQLYDLGFRRFKMLRENRQMNTGY
jgi:hypothetical protein